ncbi:hypothetical protein BGZ99_006011 [Dissophora globulifera]|nr:hypothetical protein BGZ99_006011 [Dissophora globulifera]
MTENIQIKSGDTMLGASKKTKKLQFLEHGDVSESGRNVNCIFVAEGTEISNIEFKRPNVSETEATIQNQRMSNLPDAFKKIYARLGGENQ